MSGHDDHDDYGGLHRDLLSTGAAMDRRRVLRLAAGFGALQLLGCSGVTDPTDVDDTNGNDGNPTGTCTRIPEETAGPYPARVQRAKRPESDGGRAERHPVELRRPDGIADGMPLTVELTIVSASTCAPLAGRAVYLWHCDRKDDTRCIRAA